MKAPGLPNGRYLVEDTREIRFNAYRYNGHWYNELIQQLPDDIKVISKQLGVIPHEIWKQLERPSNEQIKY